MNIAIKSLILDAGISIPLTLLGSGSFYSFLFLFVILYLPAILVFVSLDITGNTAKDAADNVSNTKKGIE